MRESPVVILWLDNLGAFYPLIAELGLSNIAAAFEGGTAVPHLIGPVPSVTEAAELVLKTGCGLDSLPVLGEVTFDRATRQHFSLKQTEFNKETGTGIARDVEQLVNSAIAVGTHDKDAEYNLCRMQGGSDAQCSE